MDTKTLNKELRRRLNYFIPKRITLDEAETRENVRIVKEVVAAVIKEMRNEDELFRELFQKEVYTGSYFDGVHVTTPREFNIDLVMVLPFEPKDVIVSHDGETSSFIRVRLRRPFDVTLPRKNKRWTPTLRQKLSNFFESLGYRHLMRNKVQNWIHGIITKARTKIEKPSGVVEITPSQSGSAFTWHIRTETRTIDVDLVPVIECTSLLFRNSLDVVPLPPGFYKSNRFKKLSKEAQTCYLVAKPAKGVTQASAADYWRWRICFPEAEKGLLHGMKAAILLIKIFKLLRDSQNWGPVNSYYIKTMFLLEFDVHPSADYWKHDNLGTLFLEMLERMRQVFSQKKLEFYYCRNENLLDNLSSATATNIAFDLSTIIRTIREDPDEICEYLGC